MAEPMHRGETAVVDMVDYLRETLRELDEAIADLSVRRQGLAVKLAVLEASTDPKVQEAAADYDARVAENRPYEDAADAGMLLSEAHRRHAE